MIQAITSSKAAAVFVEIRKSQRPISGRDVRIFIYCAALMSLRQRLSSLIARLRPADPTHPSLDTAEEFQKIQRSLRRLSLASDRGAEILQVVSSRIDELQQSLLKSILPKAVALGLEERELLRILDQLDRAAAVPDLPTAAHALIDAAKGALLTGARWQAIALTGADPKGTDIRIAEFLGEANDETRAVVRIHRILEQGYRRADGTLLRPGVVIAAAASIHANTTTPA